MEDLLGFNLIPNIVLIISEKLVSMEVPEFPLYEWNSSPNFRKTS